MKNYKFIGFLLSILNLAVASAEEDSPIWGFNAGYFNYHVPAENFLGGNIPALLKKGVVVGLIEDNDVSGLQKPTQIKGYFTYLSSHLQEKNQMLGKSVKEKVSALSQKTLGPAPDSTASTPPPAQPEPGESHLDTDALQKCALGLLPRLRMAIALSNDAARTEESADLKASLDADRFNGKIPSPTGQLCGRHLASAAGESFSLVEDAKTLSAFAAAQKSESMRSLLVAYIATFQAESPVIGNPIWKFYWKSLSLAAVFNADTALPTIDELKAQLEAADLANKDASPDVEINITPATTPRDLVTKAGLDYAEKFLASLVGS